MFDPGGSTGRLHACPVLRTWRALLCGELFDRAPDGTRGWSIFGKCLTRKKTPAVLAADTGSEKPGTLRRSPAADTGSEKPRTLRRSHAIGTGSDEPGVS